MQWVNSTAIKPFYKDGFTITWIVTFGDPILLGAFLPTIWN